MNKAFASLLSMLIISISVHAEDFQPIVEDSHYGDTLYAMIVGEEASEFDDNTMWAIDVSNEGNSVFVTVYSTDGYSIFDQPLDGVTTSAVYDDNGTLSGYVVTDDENDNAIILAFVLQEGLWTLVIEEE